jgi:hypothetical protein
MLYRVEWNIDIEADTPEDAAKQAIEIHRDHESTATIFQVTDQLSQLLGSNLDGKTRTIDTEYI